jgi:hypothetical protein
MSSLMRLSQDEAHTYKEHFLTTSVSNQIPESIAELAGLMSTYPGVWALCGGWAVDAWLGRVTRKHGDIDLVVFQDDLPAFFEHLTGWQMLAHSPDAPEYDGLWWDGRRRLTCPSHIHARPPERSGPAPADGIANAEDGFTLDIQICEGEGGEWLLSREPRIALPLTDSIRESTWGLPTALPGVLLFYKAYEPRQRDRLDFEALSPWLEGVQRDWLRDAIESVGHPWVRKLAIRRNP